MKKNQQANEQPPDQKQEEVQTIGQLKGKVCKSLQDKFSTKAMRDRLLSLAKGDESVVVANLNSFLTIIANDEGSGKWDNKKYLCQASASSLSLCFLESMQLGIPIDRRGLVHVVVYGTQAELEIDYKGFIYYLNKHYNEATFDVRLVFEGDEFQFWSESGDDKYSYKMAKNRKINDYDKVEWAFCFMTYVKNNREHSKIEVMDKRELNLVRSKAKTKNVWDEWTGEMYKKAVVRRACKLPLAAVDENAIETIDNKNFQLDRPAAEDRLQLLMQNQKEIIGDDKPAENKEQPGEAQKPVDKASSNGNTPAREDGEANAKPNPTVVVEPDSGNIQPAREEAPPQDEGANPGIIDAQYEEVETSPPTSETATFQPLPQEQPKDVWDGSTVRVNGKDQQQDFASPAAAASYLRKIMSTRKHKTSRKQMIEENSKLMGALIKDGKGSIIAELHKLADGGE